jgi:hypothetical protein
VKSNLDKGIPVGLKLDFYFLEYIEQKIHFAAHYVTIYGYDKEFGYLVDGGMQVNSSLSSISEAREKAPTRSRSGKHRRYLWILLLWKKEQ